MAPKPLPSAAYLRECLDYDPVTGALTWRSRPREHFKTDVYWRRWNTRFAGKAAGGLHSMGYRTICIGDIDYLAHRIVWRILYPGAVPDRLDHQNLDQLDNRPLNIRAATPSQNATNKGLRRDNTTGYKGVVWDRGRFVARITHEGKELHLGRFVTAEAAFAAYREAATRLHGEFARYE